MQRRMLLERFPEVTSIDPPEPVMVNAHSSDRCSICAHEQRYEIEASLADGLSWTLRKGSECHAQP